MLHNPPDNRAARDKDLLDSVVSTLRKGGLLLLPIVASNVASSVVPQHREDAACLERCTVLQDIAELQLKSLRTIGRCRNRAAAGEWCGQDP